MAEKIKKVGKYLSEEVRHTMLTMALGVAILLSAPVGAGKTTFVLKELGMDAKIEGYPILLVLNRLSLKGQLIQELCKKQCVDQEKFELNQDGCVTIGPFVVCSYQYLARRLRDFPSGETNIGPFRADVYKIVVFDEVHYLISDACFSGENDPLLRVADIFKSAKRLYISATIGPVRNLILRIERAIDLQSDVWKNLTYYAKLPFRYAQEPPRIANRWNEPFSKKDLLEIEGAVADFSYFAPRILEKSDDIPNDILSEKASGALRRAIVFVDSKREGIEWKKCLTSKGIKASFVFSENDGTEKMLDVDRDILRQIEQTGRFDAVDVLITTSVLENGVSIIDESITHIYIGGTEYISAVQQAGRVRITPEDPQRISLCFPRREIEYFQKRIFSWSGKKRALSRIQSMNPEQLAKAALTGELDQVRDLLAYDRQNMPRVSELSQYAFDYLIRDAQDSVKRLKESPNGYIEKFLSWFNLRYDNEADMRERTMKKAYKDLKVLFREKVGLVMDDNEYDEFRKKAREQYEAATGETLCSGKANRLPGPSAMARIAALVGMEIRREKGNAQIFEREDDGNALSSCVDP